MLVRIVKMHFKKEEILTFKTLFDSVAHQIRNFDGCMHLDLLQGDDDSALFFTYSYWQDAAALETYRKRGYLMRLGLRLKYSLIRNLKLGALQNK